MCSGKMPGHPENCTCLCACVMFDSVPQDLGSITYQCGCTWVITGCMPTPEHCWRHDAPQGEPYNPNPDLKTRLAMKRELAALGYDSNDVKLLQDFIKRPWVYRKD